MKRLYIDFDGVVMDTIPELYDALEKSGTDVSNHREISIFFLHLILLELLMNKIFLMIQLNV